MRAWMGTALVAGAMILPQMAMADVKAGVDAWLRGDYKMAVEQWRPLAIQGDADAQFNLAQAYKLGRGVPLDPGLAEQWFGRAAVQGHPQAQINYAIALFQSGRHDEAVPWLEKSVARGEPRAQLILGTMVFNGDSVPRDYPRAYALVSRASAAGVPKASETLAQMDQYLSDSDRQKGTALARQYENAPAASAPSELAGGRPTVRTTELPASTVAASAPPSPAPAASPMPTRVAAAVPPAPTHAPDPATGARAPQPAATSPAARASSTRPAAPAGTPVAGHGWRVQFGAFHDDANARRLWENLKAHVPEVRALTPSYARAGTLTKLQAGPLANAAAASQLCARMRVSVTGAGCVPIAP